MKTGLIKTMHTLAPMEIKSIIFAPDTFERCHALAVTVDKEEELLLIITGDFLLLKAPFSLFQPSPGSSSPAPDFSSPMVIDYGNAIKLGEYEASMDAIKDDCVEEVP